MKKKSCLLEKMSRSDSVIKIKIRATEGGMIKIILRNFRNFFMFYFWQVEFLPVTSMFYFWLLWFTNKASYYSTTATGSSALILLFRRRPLHILHIYFLQTHFGAKHCQTPPNQSQSWAKSGFPTLGRQL